MDDVGGDDDNDGDGAGLMGEVFEDAVDKERDGEEREGDEEDEAIGASESLRSTGKSFGYGKIARMKILRFRVGEPVAYMGMTKQGRMTSPGKLCLLRSRRMKRRLDLAKKAQMGVVKAMAMSLEQLITSGRIKLQRRQIRGEDEGGDADDGGSEKNTRCLQRPRVWWKQN